MAVVANQPGEALALYEDGSVRKVKADLSDDVLTPVSLFCCASWRHDGGAILCGTTAGELSELALSGGSISKLCDPPDDASDGASLRLITPSTSASPY